MSKHVKMSLTSNATCVIQRGDGTRVGFNLGPLELSPQQWVDLHDRLEAMHPDEACGYLDGQGWTRFGVEPAASTVDPWKHDRVEAAVRYLTERLSGQAVDQETRDGVVGILDGTLDENGNVRPA